LAISLIKDAIGKTLKVDTGELVTVQAIEHSFTYPNKAEINGMYLIHYVSLFAQLNGEPVDEEDIHTFDSTLESEHTKKRRVSAPNRVQSLPPGEERGNSVRSRGFKGFRKRF